MDLSITDLSNKLRVSRMTITRLIRKHNIKSVSTARQIIPIFCGNFPAAIVIKLYSFPEICNYLPRRAGGNCASR